MSIMTSRAFRHKVRALAVTAVAIAIVFLLTPKSLTSEERLVIAWDAGAVTLLVATWYLIGRATPEDTRRWAAIDDPGQLVAIGIDLLGSVISFTAAVLLPAPQGLASTPEGVALVIVAVTISWALMPPCFTVRYAHLY